MRDIEKPGIQKRDFCASQDTQKSRYLLTHRIVTNRIDGMQTYYYASYSLLPFLMVSADSLSVKQFFGFQMIAFRRKSAP